MASISRKRYRGQALLELIGIVPCFLAFFSILGFAGWWTYGRMSALSVAYTRTLLYSMNPHAEPFAYPSDVDIEMWDDLTSGTPFWYGIGFHYIEPEGGYSSGLKSNFTNWVSQPVAIQGVIIPGEETEIFSNPNVQVFGYPKSTVTGMLCLFCGNSYQD